MMKWFCCSFVLFHFEKKMINNFKNLVPIQYKRKQIKIL